MVGGAGLADPDGARLRAADRGARSAPGRAERGLGHRLAVALRRSRRVRCADSGPARVAATAGDGTRVGYGRFGGAREFTRVVDSFVYAPAERTVEPQTAFTVEAWVYPRSFGRFEDTPIAARWTQEANRQSWIFGIVGRRSAPLPSSREHGYHDAWWATARRQLFVAFQRLTRACSGDSCPRRASPDQWTTSRDSTELVRFSSMHP